MVETGIWTDAEEKFLYKHYNKKSMDWLSMRLGRTERAIYKKAHELGLKKERMQRNLDTERYERMKKDVGMKFKWNTNDVHVIGVELNTSHINGVDRVDHTYWISDGNEEPIHVDYNRMQQILREVYSPTK